MASNGSSNSSSRCSAKPRQRSTKMPLDLVNESLALHEAALTLVDCGVQVFLYTSAPHLTVPGTEFCLASGSFPSAEEASGFVCKDLRRYMDSAVAHEDTSGIIAGVEAAIRTRTQLPTDDIRAAYEEAEEGSEQKKTLGDFVQQLENSNRALKERAETRMYLGADEVGKRALRPPAIIAQHEPMQIDDLQGN